MKTIIFNGWAFKNKAWNDFLNRLGFKECDFYNESRSNNLDADIYFSWSLGFLDLLNHFSHLNSNALFVCFSPCLSFINRENYGYAIKREDLQSMIGNIDSNYNTVLKLFHKKSKSHLDLSSYIQDPHVLKLGLKRLETYDFTKFRAKEKYNALMFAASEDKIINRKQSLNASERFKSKLFEFNTANHSFFLEEKFINDIQNKIKTAL